MTTVRPPASEAFRCPRCCGRLVAGAPDLACEQCGRVYPVTDGILDFRVEKQDYYFNPVPRDEMRALTLDMEQLGWERTVQRFLRYVRQPSDWIDNLTVDGRYAWKLLLDLRPDGVLLDIGCGLGNLSYNLSPHVGTVYAMDLTHERAVFARQRFKTRCGRDNAVVLAGGDGRYLPFPAASIDYVVLSGVLEWIGEGGVSGLDEGPRPARVWRMVRGSLGHQSPRALQLRFLREIRRVLRPNGQLFVAIENRTGYRYFLGDADPHSGIPFSSLLPRFLANLYSIWIARRPYRTYTYSIPGHRRLLRQAGFPHVEFFGLSPGYSHLQEVVPLETANPRWRPTPSVGLRARVARNRYLVPAYGIVAGRRPAGMLMDRVMDAVDAALRGRLGAGRIQISDYSVTGKDKGLLTAVYAGAPILLKLPFGAAARAGEARNARFLQSAKSGFAKALAYLPHSLTVGVVDGVDYAVEERCSGRPLSHTILRDGRTVLLALVEAMLGDLNPGPPPAVRAVDRDLLLRRVVYRLDLVRDVLPGPVRSALESFFLDRLASVNLPRGIEHGDFGCDNILTDGQVLTGLVDWEAADPEGIPLLDALGYLEGVERLCGGRSLGATIPLLAKGEWPNRDEWAFLERQYRRLGVDRAHHEVLVYLYWLHHISGQVPYGLAYHQARVERDVVGVATYLLDTA